MGKTKIKTIDDSQIEESKKPAKKLGRSDELVEKLKAELGVKDTGKSRPEDNIQEVRGDSEEGSRRVAAATPSLSRGSEDARRDTEPAGPRTKRNKPSKAKPRSKKYQAAVKDLDRSKFYPLPEAIDMVKKLSYSKFDGTLEAHINTLQTGVRGFVSLPYAKVVKVRILAFGKGVADSGADIFGDEKILEDILKGQINFDILITTPEWMQKLATVAKILGPKGLMPNPKNGTIADDLGKAVESFRSGKSEFKTEAKTPIIHSNLGKLSQPKEELLENTKILLSTIGKSKIKKVTLSPTMGPSVKLDLSSI